MNHPDESDAAPTPAAPHSPPMSFLQTVDRASDLLRQRGRLSIQALRLEFALDTEHLDALLDELVEVQAVADREGKVLVWRGSALPEAAPAVAPPVAPVRPEPPLGSAQTQTSLPTGERRQLTVVFCDLVGSTELSRRLDAEDWRDLVSSYHDAAASVIEHHGGYVAQYLGDGVLAYFGYPHADEDDAVSAVHAGLGILARLHEMNAAWADPTRLRLAARVGIHAGEVVVSSIGSGASLEMHAFGDAVNIAARVQSEAAPDTVVLSPAARRLVGGRFRLRDLGDRPLKGVGTLQLHEVQGTASADTPQQQANARAAVFVGRDRELQLLLDQWLHAKEGEGGAVLLSGEAGLGKSQLFQAFEDRLEDNQRTLLKCFCVRDRRASAYYPLVDLIGRALGFADTDTPGDKLRKVEQAAADAGLQVAEVVPLLAALLALPAPTHLPPLLYAADVRRQKANEALCSWLLAIASNQPLILLFEDLDWCDPSTLQFLGHLLEQCASAPVLALASFRPEFAQPWPQRAHLQQLQLPRLTRAQAEQLIATLAGDFPLPDDVVQHIVARADGVPLFVEELTKTGIETLLRVEPGEPTPLLDRIIPATLQGSLMARLDRLGPRKRIAQLCAVLGRRFDYALLHGVAELDDDELAAALRDLIAADVLHVRGTPPAAQYTFRHALVHDTAYQSLLRSERRSIHADIATAMTTRFPDRAADAPEVVAHHYDEAGQTAQAILHYRRAAVRAKRQFANEEALLHLRRALRLLETLPPSDSRDELELGLQLAFGEPLYISYGFANAEYGRHLDRAYQLCNTLGRDAERARVLIGLGVHHQVAGRLDRAADCAVRSIDDASASGNAVARLIAHARRSQVLYLQGEFVEALAEFERTMALSATENANEPAELAAIGGATSALWGIRALCRWSLGYADQALELCHAALARARDRNDPFDVTAASIYAAWIHQKRGERREALTLAEEARGLCMKYGFSWRPWAVVLHACVSVDAARTDTRNGSAGSAALVETIRVAIAELRAAGTQGWLPHCYSALAELCLHLGRLDDALLAVDDGLACSATTGQHYEDSALQLLRAETLAAAPDTDAATVRAAFEAALDIAEAQRAPALQLRAAIGLARQLQPTDERASGYARLATIARALPEGATTADARAAAALLRNRDTADA